MMENRSFDHMLGGLRALDPRIEGLTGVEFNEDTKGDRAFVKAQAVFQGQLDSDPDHHFAGVDLQIFGGNMAPDRSATMGGFVKSYFAQRKDVK
jgi:phospholipase C